MYIYLFVENIMTEIDNYLILKIIIKICEQIIITSQIITFH